MKHALALSLLTAGASFAQVVGTVDQSNVTPANITAWMMFSPFLYEQSVEVGRDGVLAGFIIRIAPGQAPTGPLPVEVIDWDAINDLPGATLWSGAATAPNTGLMQSVFVDVSAAGLGFSQGDFFGIRVGDPAGGPSDWNLSSNSGWNSVTNMPYAQYPHSLFEDGVRQSIHRLVFESYLLPPLPGAAYCGPAVPNSTGVSGALRASGSNVVSANSLTLEASALPPNAFGFFLTSRTRGLVANPGGSQGNLCLGGSIGRYVGPGQIMSSGASGAFSLLLDLNATPLPSGLVAIAPGDTWDFQAWHRDSVGGLATSNFTHGLEVQFQ